MSSETLVAKIAKARELVALQHAEEVAEREGQITTADRAIDTVLREVLATFTKEYIDKRFDARLIIACDGVVSKKNKGTANELLTSLRAGLVVPMRHTFAFGIYYRFLLGDDGSEFVIRYESGRSTGERLQSNDQNLIKTIAELCEVFETKIAELIHVHELI